MREEINSELGMDLVLAKAEINTLKHRIQELEKQLEEYHKFDGFLMAHGCFGDPVFITNEEVEHHE